MMSKQPNKQPQCNSKKISPSYWLIIPAAGKGRRMGISTPKQYLLLHDKTVLEHTLERFLPIATINKIILVLDPTDTIWSTLATPYKEKITVVMGGEHRVDSVLNGLTYLQNFAEPHDWVLVHDAVRPCVRHEDINKLIKNLADHTVGGLLGIPVRDTLKRADIAGNVVDTLNRENIWQALTPQMFRFGKLFHGLQMAVQNNNVTTDEAAALEAIGETPKIIAGHSDNIKITYPEDLFLAEKILHGYETNIVEIL